MDFVDYCWQCLVFVEYIVILVCCEIVVFYEVFFVLYLVIGGDVIVDIVVLGVVLQCSVIVVKIFGQVGDKGCLVW